MCFYNSQSKRAMDLAHRYGRKSDILEIVQEILDEQYKITAFTHPDCAVITSNQNIQIAKWGLIPGWIKSENEADKVRKMTINARSETVFNLPSFRIPILQKRCLIPSTGFFEFHHEGKNTIPYYIFLKDEDIFSLGGIYETWLNPVTKKTLQTFTVLTVPANELCAKIHNGGKTPFRMPLIINKEDERQWLDNSLKADEIKRFFTPYDSRKMDAYSISKDFIRKSPNDASIIEPAA
jgi:putative SOS response-associated peptidase YedK